MQKKKKFDKYGDLNLQVYCMPYCSYVRIFTKKSVNPRNSRP